MLAGDETGPSTAGPAASASVSRASAGSSQTASSRKRPRRSVASTVKSYAIPDSDDEDIVVDGEDDTLQRFAKKRKAESNMQQWIKQLTLLFKEEQKKVRTWTELFHVDMVGIAAEGRCRLVSVDVACRCPSGRSPCSNEAANPEVARVALARFSVVALGHSR